MVRRRKAEKRNGRVVATESLGKDWVALRFPWLILRRRKLERGKPWMCQSPFWDERIILLAFNFVMTFFVRTPPHGILLFFFLSFIGHRKAHALFFRTKIGHQFLSSFSCSRAKYRPWNLSANISLGPFLSSLAVALKKDLEIVARISPATLSFLLLQSRYAQTLKSWRESLARFFLFFPAVALRSDLEIVARKPSAILSFLPSQSR